VVVSANTGWRAIGFGLSPVDRKGPQMTRFSRLIVSTLVAVVIWVFGAFAIAGPPPEAGQTVKTTMRRSGAVFPYIPGFWELRMEHTRQELELTDEQEEALNQIGQKYYQQMRQDWAGLRGMSAEERTKKYAEIREKNVERAEEIRKQVEELLSPDQLDHLKQINLRTRGAALMANLSVLERLGVNQEQKEKLRQIREDMQEKMRQLQQATLEKSLEVLTPQQRKQLEEMTARGFRDYGIGSAAGEQ
jgi:Spy/CpxP family protein refolding chaperone